MRPIVIALALALLAFGSISDRWFVEQGPPAVVHEGVLSSSICGPDTAQELEAFANSQSTGASSPVRWTCERTFHVTLVSKIHRAADLAFWLVDLLCVIAGLATATALGVSLARRQVARPLTVSAAVALAAAVAAIASGFLGGGYTPSDLGLGAVSYVIGALLALATRLFRARA